MARRRDSTGLVVRVGSGTDHRRVPYPARHLASATTGRRTRGDVPGTVERHRADCSELPFVGRDTAFLFFAALQLVLQPLPAAFRPEVRRINHLDRKSVV